MSARTGRLPYLDWLRGVAVVLIARSAVMRLTGEPPVLEATPVLIIGVLVSMFTAVTVTRTILRVIVQQSWARKASLYGVTEEEFLARPTSGRGSMRGEARGRV